MSDSVCVFEQVTPEEVRCIYCGRGLSGAPERYKDKLICKERMGGPGTEIEKIFKKWARVLNINFRPCNSCSQIKQKMDVRGKPWVKENIDGLAAAIKRNAAAQGIKVPEVMVKKWLKKVSR